MQSNICILEHEIQDNQPIYLDVEFDTFIQGPRNDQDISSVLDYRLLRHQIIEICTTQHVDMFETLVESLCESILERFPTIIWLKIRISKPQAFVDCAAVGIEMQQRRPAAKG